MSLGGCRRVLRDGRKTARPARADPRTPLFSQARRIQRQAEDGPLSEAEAPARRTLGVLRPSAGPGSSGPAPRLALSRPAQQGAAAEAGALAVYEDGPQEAAGPWGLVAHGPVRGQGPGAVPWTSLNGAEASRKENALKPAPWAGQRLGGGGRREAAEPLEIAVDPEFAVDGETEQDRSRPEEGRAVSRSVRSKAWTRQLENVAFVVCSSAALAHSSLFHSSSLCSRSGRERPCRPGRVAAPSCR